MKIRHRAHFRDGLLLYQQEATAPDALSLHTCRNPARIAVRVAYVHDPITGSSMIRKATHFSHTSGEGRFVRSGRGRPLSSGPLTPVLNPEWHRQARSILTSLTPGGGVHSVGVAHSMQPTCVCRPGLCFGPLPCGRHARRRGSVRGADWMLIFKVDRGNRTLATLHQGASNGLRSRTNSKTPGLSGESGSSRVVGPRAPMFTT